MAPVKAYFAVGLLMTAFCTSVLSVTQDVPDDVVYTDVTKTLIRNNTGVLTCLFKGTPLAVYWKKGSDPRNAPLLVRLHYGEKSGPRYEDGSCDIDENYSLVIKRVGNEDAGRYICRVSNYKGTLIHNFTDITITDTAVETRSVVALQKGKPGVLPCEPGVRPNKVSWIRNPNEKLITMELSGNVPDRSGPGYDEGLYNITEEYSLVIKDVMIMHEDRYICEVTDYDTENLFWNATELSVFALPVEPFPSIEECPQEQQNLPSCTLRITSLTSLTCHVEGYYPNIDLFFIHGSERVDSLETRVWNNSDGTKSKRITVSSDGTSDTLFECVAAGLFGQTDSRSMTIHLIRDAQQSHAAAAVVVPVIFVSAIIVIAVLVFKRKKALWKQEYERVRMEPTQKDLISYIEIWMLVKYAVQQKDSKNLASVLDLLLGDEAESGTLNTEEEYYKEICRWKEEYTGVSQRKDFFDAFRRQGLKPALDQLQRYSDFPKELTSDDLEHTLWHVGERDRITELLKRLGAPPEKISTLQNKNMKDVIVGAMNVLKSYWAEDVNSTGNQEVMLSMALEKINYSPNEEDFFRLTNRQKSYLDKQEILTFLPTKVTSRHCTVLVDAMMKLKEKHALDKLVFGPIKSKDVWIDEVIEENRTHLFDSHQMIEDWWAEQNCSNYVKRCRLHKAADVLQDQVELGASGETWPRRKKLEQIVTLVPQSQLTYLWKALGISYDSDDLTSEGKRLEVMCKWRNNLIKMKQEEKYKLLATALKSIGFDGFLYHQKGKFIYKAELVDMALDLIMEDFRPFAHALGIKGIRLGSYKRAFQPSHLELGTISLVLQLAKMTGNLNIIPAERSTVCNNLNEAGYRNATSRFKFASEPSYGELFAFGAALTQGNELKVDDMTTKKGKSVEKSNNNEVADTEQPPSKAATRDDKPNVDLPSNKTTGERNPAENSNNNESANTEQSPSGAATQFDEIVHETTGKSELDEQSGINMAAIIEQPPSRAASNGVESNGENRLIPMDENKPQKEGLDETSALDATQSRTDVGQGSHETSEEKTPTEKSQGEILKSVLQETPRSEATLTSVDEEKTQTDYVRDTEGRCGNNVDDLKRILGLTDAVLPESSNNPVLMMFKIWKERICPELTDHRVVLAEGLKEIGKPHLVRDLINGEYHSNKTSIEFIEDMLKGMDEDRLNSLEGLLKEKGKIKWPKSSSGITQAIFDWVANWTEEVKPTVAHQFRDALLFKEKSKKHRDFNNKLVEHGFLNLAREIMNIEEYWLTT